MHLTRPAAAAVLLLLAACATAQPATTRMASTGEVALADARAPVVVRVTSRYAGPLAIYSMDRGVATRLGDVSGGRVEQFTIAATQVPTDGLTFIAVPHDGDLRASTGRLRLAPGNIVEFTIGPTLTDATAAVRSP